jgi:serine/threonine protein kinase
MSSTDLNLPENEIIADPAGDGCAEMTIELPVTSACIHVRYPAAPSPIKVGRILRDRYVIQERLATGGMGTVYRALDRYRTSLPPDERFVGIKILHSCAECCERTIADLQQELHCGQGLSHPNIVNVFELDRDDDIVFLTMELLAGESLQALLERMRPTPMRTSQAWSLIRQLGSGLAHAHARGVVHGDLKPRNVFVTDVGELRILDFGAAHAFVDTAAGGLAPPPAQRSSVTLAYASCEQLEGRPAVPSDDLYAFACICYELLTGAHPFATRPANLARDFGVRPARPVDITYKQWKTLQTGLCFHRAGRSINVSDWTRRLLSQIPQGEAAVVPLGSYMPRVQRPLRKSWHGASIICGAFVTLLSCIAVSRIFLSSGDRSPAVAAATAVVEKPASSTLTVDPLLPTPTPSNSTPVEESHRAEATAGPSKAAPAGFLINYKPIKPNAHFVELIVARTGQKSAAVFKWWTEAVTAKQDVDYVHQGAAIQTTSRDKNTARIYVKLMPEAIRKDRAYFFVAVADPAKVGRVTRTAIWLPVHSAASNAMQSRSSIPATANPGDPRIAAAGY